MKKSEILNLLQKHGIEHRHEQVTPEGIETDERYTEDEKVIEKRKAIERRKKKREDIEDKRCCENAKAQQLFGLIERRRIRYLAHLYNRVKLHLDSSQKLEQEQLEGSIDTSNPKEMRSVDADVVVPSTIEAVYDFLADTYLEENQDHDEEFKILLGVDSYIAISSDGITYQEKDYVPPHKDLANGLSMNEVLLLRDKLKKIIELIDSCCIEEKKHDFHPPEIEWPNHQKQEKHVTRVMPQDCSEVMVLLLESSYPELVDQPNSQKIVRTDQVFTRNNFSIADVLLAPAYLGLLHVDTSRTDKCQKDIFLKKCEWEKCGLLFHPSNLNQIYRQECRHGLKKDSRDKNKKTEYNRLAKLIKLTKQSDQSKLMFLDNDIQHTAEAISSVLGKYEWQAKWQAKKIGQMLTHETEFLKRGILVTKVMDQQQRYYLYRFNSVSE